MTETPSLRLSTLPSSRCSASLYKSQPPPGIFPPRSLRTAVHDQVTREPVLVRNSIILVDLIELRIREGMSLAEAVIDAGSTRFRPMLLTAAAVVVGASVILTDPIFQGLALSLIARGHVDQGRHSKQTPRLSGRRRAAGRTLPPHPISTFASCLKTGAVWGIFRSGFGPTPQPKSDE